MPSQIYANIFIASFYVLCITTCPPGCKKNKPCLIQQAVQSFEGNYENKKSFMDIMT